MGSLPEGLLFLRFGPEQTEYDEKTWLPPLLPGVLPSTLLAVDFTDRSREPLPAGVIPRSVRWVRLWSRYWYRHGDLSDVEVPLPPCAQLEWYRYEPC